jgi:ubiquinone/menaquinone biosynthesis C-methylase UbiE
MTFSQTTRSLPLAAPGFIALLAVIVAHALLSPAGHYRADLLLGLLAIGIAYIVITCGLLVTGAGLAVCGLAVAESIGGDIRVANERESASRFRELVASRISRLQGSPGYWQTVALTRQGLYVTRVEAAFIQDALAREAPGVVADVGSGSGRLHFAMAPYARTVVATDIDHRELGRTERDARVSPVAVSTLPVLPFRDASVDAVVAMEVPAVSDEPWFLSECERTLKPGGTVLVTLYNRRSYKGMIASLLKRRREAKGLDWAGTYYRYSASEQVLRWREAGFGEVRQLGLYWSPARRDSDGALVSIGAIIERLLGLHRLTALSPWVLLELRKL